MLELWGMRSTPSLPSFPGPLWPGVVVPDRILSMGQIELNNTLTPLDLNQQALRKIVRQGPTVKVVGERNGKLTISLAL